MLTMKKNDITSKISIDPIILKHQVQSESQSHVNKIKENMKKEWKKPELTIIGIKTTDLNEGTGNDGGYTGANAS